VLIGTLAVQLVLKLINIGSDGWQPSQSAAGELGPSHRVDLEAIVAAKLFGNYDAPSNATSVELQSAPEAPLNMTVVGILANADQQGGSRALIVSANERESPYAVGDFITDAVKVSGIFPDHVAIVQRGRPKTLDLVFERADVKIDYVTAAPAASVNPEQAALAKLTEMRKQIAQNPATVSTFYRMQPNIVKGKFQGMRIFPGTDNTLFDTTGLISGDIVTSFNGIALRDPANAEYVVSSLAGDSPLEIVVDRGGKPQTLHVSAQTSAKVENKTDSTAPSTQNFP